MRVFVPAPIPGTPEHSLIAAMEWECEPATWEEGRNRQTRKGYELRGRVPGFGWQSVYLETNTFTKYVDSGQIKEA